MSKIVKQLKDSHRIVILGNNGAGKSYLAKQLANLLTLPLIHLDLAYWGPNWTPTPGDQWLQRQEEMAGGDQWIIDGNHTSTLEARLKRADLVLFLDINRLTCLISAIGRLRKPRTDMPQELKDRVDHEFFKFLYRLWQFDRDRKPLIMSLKDTYPEANFVIIKSRDMMNAVIKELEGD